MAPRFCYACLPDHHQHCARDVEVHVSETSHQQDHDQPAAYFAGSVSGRSARLACDASWGGEVWNLPTFRHPSS